MFDSKLPFFAVSFAETASEGGAGEAEAPDEQSLIEETTTEEEPEKGTGSEGDEPVEGEEHLGDPGKKALDRMKAQLKAEKAKNRELRAKYEPKEPREAEADMRFHKKVLRAEIKAAAKGELQDPNDAYRFLDLDQFEVTSDGDVDEEEVADAIADLLRRKPYLGKRESKPKGQGSLEGGVRNESVPAQLSRADLARMTPQAILAADAKGLLKDLKQGR